MKNLILLFLSLIIILSACQDSTKKSTVKNNPPPTPSTETSQPSKLKPAVIAEPQGLYIKGGGNEPGWNIKITKETDTEFSFDLVMNYGQDKHNGIFTSSKKEDTESFVGKDEEGNEISVIFKKENCRDDGDFDHNRSIILKMKNNTYTGCGDKEK